MPISSGKMTKKRRKSRSRKSKRAKTSLIRPQIKVYSVGTRNYFVGILLLTIAFLIIFLFFSASIVLMVLFGILFLIGGVFYWVMDLVRRKN